MTGQTMMTAKELAAFMFAMVCDQREDLIPEVDGDVTIDDLAPLTPEFALALWDTGVYQDFGLTGSADLTDLQRSEFRAEYNLLANS